MTPSAPPPTIGPAQATDLITQQVLTLPDEMVALASAAGRVLRETVVADRPFPPFDRVAMDGIALARADWEAAGQPPLTIEGLQMAGAPPLTRKSPTGGLEVMTGAVLPAGTDTVVRYEDVDIAEGRAHIRVPPARTHQNVHQKGTDQPEGATLLRPGQRLTAAEIAVAATVGRAQLRVARMPRVALVATGDELVEVDAEPAPHQIRGSNMYALAAALQSVGVAADRHHVRDDQTTLRQHLGQWLTAYDVLVLSGGVSRGKADYLPAVLAELGVVCAFHRVAQRPGKPFWFGYQPDGAVVFALPGNPVSTTLCYYRYVQPWLLRSLGQTSAPAWAVLTADTHFAPSLTYFLSVKLTAAPDGRLLATPVAGGGSGDLMHLTAADGWLELPADRQHFAAGEAWPLWRYRA